MGFVNIAWRPHYFNLSIQLSGEEGNDVEEEEAESTDDDREVKVVG